MKGLRIVLAAVLVLACAGTALAEEKVITMSTTTSTLESGLLDTLLPLFKEKTGIEVKVVAKGTGAAIRDAIDGNVDVIFVHDRPREEAFVQDGYGTKRYAVMHNDFIFLGPANDPVGVKGSASGGEAAKKISEAKATFISRGDDSGTHVKEQELWRAGGVEIKEITATMEKDGKVVEFPAVAPRDAEGWYLSVGQGMGKTLILADEKQAYTLADRGTYIKYKHGRDLPIELEIVCEGGDQLANPYGVIPVNPAKHPHVKVDLAETFANWLVSAEGQQAIADYKLLGQQLFFPDAN